MRSASVKFYLESRVKGDPEKLLPIFLYIRHGGKTIKVFTTRKCTRNGWDVIRSRANFRKFKSATELNSFLSDLETEATNLYNYNQRSSIHTGKEQLVRLIDEVAGNRVEQLDLVKFAESFLNTAAMAENTQKSYRNTINLLKEYTRTKHRLLAFEDISLDFYDRFTEFMWKEKHYNDNTVGKHIKNIKRLMNESFQRDLHSNLAFKKKGFKVLHKSSDSIYLTEHELESLIQLSLTDRLTRIRDAFYVGCWIGLRFSDLVRVSKEKFTRHGNMLSLTIKTEKTGQVISIPIAPNVLPILEKYEYSLPVLSNQKMNQALKELGKLMGLTDEIEIKEEKNGRKITERVPKYTLITTHTARRSFATNLFLQGVKPEIIRAVTGHKTEKEFLNYLKLSNIQKAQELDDHFKSKMKVV